MKAYKVELLVTDDGITDKGDIHYLTEKQIEEELTRYSASGGGILVVVRSIKEVPKPHYISPSTEGY